MAEFLHNKAQALLCGRGGGVGTSPPHPCHFPQLRVHLPATFWGPSFVHPQGLPGPLLSCRAGEARLPAIVWEQGHPAQPPKGRERNEWQRARDGSGDVRTWGKGSQTPCEKTAAQQCRGAAQQLCATHTMVRLHRARRCSHPTLWHHSQGVSTAGTQPRPRPRCRTAPGPCRVRGLLCAHPGCRTLVRRCQGRPHPSTTRK